MHVSYHFLTNKAHGGAPACDAGGREPVGPGASRGGRCVYPTPLCSGTPRAEGEGHVRTQEFLKLGSARRRAACLLWRRGRCPGRAPTPSHKAGWAKRNVWTREGCGTSHAPDRHFPPRRRAGSAVGLAGAVTVTQGQRPPSSPGSPLWVRPAWAEAALLRGSLSSLSYSATRWQAQSTAAEAPGPSLPPLPSPAWLVPH